MLYRAIGSALCCGKLLAALCAELLAVLCAVPSFWQRCVQCRAFGSAVCSAELLAALCAVPSCWQRCAVPSCRQRCVRGCRAGAASGRAAGRAPAAGPQRRSTCSPTSSSCCRAWAAASALTLWTRRSQRSPKYSDAQPAATHIQGPVQGRATRL